MIVDGIKNPVACFYLTKDDCTRSLGCEWSYRGKGHCRPDYAIYPLRTVEDAKKTIDRVIRVLNEAPPDVRWRAWKEASYLVNTLPHSPSWKNVPWEVKWYIMTEGKERVYDAYYRIAQREGIKTRIKPIAVSTAASPARARRFI